MRKRSESYGDDSWRTLPIGPVLVLFGGDEPPSGYGEKPYRCPFHGDSSASGTVFTVEGEEQWFNCHAGQGCPTGNAVQIMMKAEGLDFKSAIERAEEVAGDSNSPIRKTSGRSGRMAGRAGARSGVRAFRRSWRSD